MKTKTITILILSLLLINFSAFSSEKENGQNWCISKAPDMNWENQIQKIIQKQKAANMANGRVADNSYSIPVIVHICYYSTSTSQNIPASRVQTQIDILNADFAGTGQNSNTLPAPFAAVKTNSNITFCLAKLDLNNNILAEPGIERINAKAKGWGNPATATGWSGDFIDNVIKKATIWDPNYYLNIWVVPYIGGFSSSVLGYATFPYMTGLDGMPTGAGDPLNDGFVCRTSYFGNSGGGRTATHEIGHWLGLRHIWGDETCGTDYVDDTPTASDKNFGCPSYPHNVNGCGAGSSPNGEMYMNFMDYTDDNCMALFTNDQATRFYATMEYADFRKNLKNSPVCDTVKQKPVANFSYLKTNAPLCNATQKFNFTDKSVFAPTSWSWTFDGGTPATSNQKNPTNIVFNTSGLHTITLIVSNDRGSDTLVSQLNVPIVGNGTLPLSEDFESPYFPPLGWETYNRNGNPTINWEIRNGYSGYGIGNKTMIFNNTSYDGQHKKDDITTPKLDFTGVSEAVLSFDVAYAPFFGDAGNGFDEFLWDTLEVLITDDCQLTSQSIYRKGETDLATYPQGYGPEYYPANNEWRTDSILIPASYLNKQDVQIIFRNYGDYGHTIYVDNINISLPNAGPAATANFTISDSVVCAGGKLTFTSTSSATNGGTLDSIRWTLT
ncbi:MAG: choice-of-anchor J domain-containing protein, partial [Bacteroidetes bacterium]|nr:choice-of-anchor J domain-containing protein [Bacteroidota bacterium]